MCFSCSLDYGSQSSASSDLPDLVMRDIEYVRVQNGVPLIRFQAESAERYEAKRQMLINGLDFEQFIKDGSDIDATGSVSEAQVDTSTNNITMTNGVVINAQKEDVTIESFSLQWTHAERLLQSGPDETVVIKRDDGSRAAGLGFSADARSRSWNFVGAVEGVYIHEDEDDEAE
jgi:LPS export ABC transporter protein LptC